MIRYVETSMLTGFGLEYIYKYLGIPFLQLQKDILRQQLELKTKELVTLLDTLDDSEHISASARKQHSITNDIQDPKRILYFINFFFFKYFNMFLFVKKLLLLFY